MSGCAGDVDMLRERIPEGLLSFSFSRSQGPGGQNVNKVNTRVTLWFDLDGCEALNNVQKRRIRAGLASRVNRGGLLRVVAARQRSQLANRRAATERFYELLADALRVRRPRKPTGVPHRVKRQRLEDKRRRSQTKSRRGGRGTVESGA